MKVNGYEIPDEPTAAEFSTYFKVERYFEQEGIAEWLGDEDDDDERRLTQDEFEKLCWRFHDGDFSPEQADYLHYLKGEIINERS